jgi:hypothetical protein
MNTEQLLITFIYSTCLRCEDRLMCWTEVTCNDDDDDADDDDDDNDDKYNNNNST